MATSHCESVALENVIKAMLNAYQDVQRDGKELTEEALELAHLSSSSPSILCFDNGSHGTTFGTLSLSQTNVFAKADVPKFHWPVAPFPKYKYPLEEYHFQNKCQDANCLSRVEELIYNLQDTGLLTNNYYIANFILLFIPHLLETYLLT